MQVYTCIPKITMPFVVSFLKKDFIQVPVKLQNAYCYLYDNISQNTKYLLVLICSCMSTCIKYHARIELKFHIYPQSLLENLLRDSIRCLYLS